MRALGMRDGRPRVRELIRDTLSIGVYYSNAPLFGKQIHSSVKIIFNLFFSQVFRRFLAFNVYRRQRHEQPMSRTEATWRLGEVRHNTLGQLAIATSLIFAPA